VVPRGPQLLDPQALSRAVRGASAQFRVRGMEATVDGCLARQGRRILLRIGGSGGLLRLAPLRHKVQWDRRRNREALPTESELLAFRRLLDRRHALGRRVRVIGPVVVTADGQPPILQVRQFSWRG
jgi:hypothetical protein